MSREEKRESVSEDKTQTESEENRRVDMRRKQNSRKEKRREEERRGRDRERERGYLLGVCQCWTPIYSWSAASSPTAVSADCTSAQSAESGGKTSITLSDHGHTHTHTHTHTHARTHTHTHTHACTHTRTHTHTHTRLLFLVKGAERVRAAEVQVDMCNYGQQFFLTFKQNDKHLR